MSADIQHSVLGASNAARWMACPGSVKLSEGIENVPSQYAVEGSLAHSVAEERINATNDHYIGSITNGDEQVVPSGMNESTDLYVKLVRELAAMSDWHVVEAQFNLAPLNPPVEAYGTADFVGYIGKDNALVVCDLKYGSGLLVEVENNIQLKYYALGALLTFQQASLDQGEEAPPVDVVRMIIVQPRAEHKDGKVREATMTYDELMEFSFDLIDAMHKTQEDDAPLVVGSHCRFCKAAAICPALMAHNQEIAQAEFMDMPENGGMSSPEAMTNADVGHLLEKLESIEHWIASVRLYAVAELERGNKVPGWKMVAKRATRKWKDESSIIQWLASKGVPNSEHYTRKIKSPRQVEITLGAHGITKGSVPVDLMTSESSGTKLARASSPEREVTAGSEFFDD